jgi:hypothetical protein
MLAYKHKLWMAIIPPMLLKQPFELRYLNWHFALTPTEHVCTQTTRKPHLLPPIGLTQEHLRFLSLIVDRGV